MEKIGRDCIHQFTLLVIQSAEKARKSLEKLGIAVVFADWPPKRLKQGDETLDFRRRKQTLASLVGRSGSNSAKRRVF
jgi:hypothetical protein